MRYVAIPVAFVVCGLVAAGAIVAVCAGLAHLFVAYAGLSRPDAQIATQVAFFVVILAACGLAMACDSKDTP